MRNFSRLSIIVSHDVPDDYEGDTAVEMTNGHSSITLSSLESALDMLPPGSRVQVVAHGTVGDKTVHRLSRIIRESCVLVALDLSAVEELSRVFNSPYQGNQNLLEIRFPENLLSINPRAFANCTALEAVRVPASCVKVGAEAFLGCTRLSRLEFVCADGWFCDDGGEARPVPPLSDAAEAPAFFAPADGDYSRRVLYKPAGKSL